MEAKALGSTPSHHGVCGRHGGEEARVTQGDLVVSKRQGLVEIMGHLQTKGQGTGNTNIDLEPPGGRRG